MILAISSVFIKLIKFCRLLVNLGNVSNIKKQSMYFKGLNEINLTYYIYCCSVAKLCPALWDPIDCSTPGSFVLCYLLEFTQIHIHPLSQ